MEFAVLTVDPETKQPKAKIYKPAEIDALLLAEGLTKKDQDTEMKAAWFRNPYYVSLISLENALTIHMHGKMWQVHVEPVAYAWQKSDTEMV